MCASAVEIARRAITDGHLIDRQEGERHRKRVWERTPSEKKRKVSPCKRDVHSFSLRILDFLRVIVPSWICMVSVSMKIVGGVITPDISFLALKELIIFNSLLVTSLQFKFDSITVRVKGTFFEDDSRYFRIRVSFYRLNFSVNNSPSNRYFWELVATISPDAVRMQKERKDEVSRTIGEAFETRFVVAMTHISRASHVHQLARTLNAKINARCDHSIPFFFQFSLSTRFAALAILINAPR